jgi:G3E family GTPase
VRALSNLYKKVKLFDGIIIETTGLADPAPIIQTFFQNPDIQKKFKLDGVVTVVDAKHIMERLAEVKTDGAVNEAIEQIAFADKILLNKTDLVSDDAKLAAIEGEIKSINATVQILRTKFSKVDDPKKELLNIGGFDLSRALEMDEDFLNVERKHRKDRAVKTICMELKGEMQMNLVKDWIGLVVGGEDENEHGSDEEGHHDHDHDHEKKNVLYRYKGILAIKGETPSNT